MEHHRGHVSSTFFHRALINPDIVHLPPHDFLPELGRERVSSPDFWLEIRAAAGKTRKREANPGKLDRERGCCTPDLPSANAGCGDTPRFSIIYRLKPRKIAPAFKIIPNLFLRSRSFFSSNSRNNVTSNTCISFYRGEWNRLVLFESFRNFEYYLMAGGGGGAVEI